MKKNTKNNLRFLCTQARKQLCFHDQILGLMAYIEVWLLELRQRPEFPWRVYPRIGLAVSYLTTDFESMWSVRNKLHHSSHGNTKSW